MEQITPPPAGSRRDLSSTRRNWIISILYLEEQDVMCHPQRETERDYS
jgi:hypothetical protein